MNDDDDLAEVIPLPRAFGYSRNEMEAKLDELPVREARKAAPCRHSGSFVDPSARTLTCRSCGAALDPIAVLARLARGREGLVRNGVLLRRQVDDLRKEVESLERQERNAKSRIRTARKRRGDDEAVRAAARALFEAKRLAPFDDLPVSLQEDWIRATRPAVEAYLAVTSAAGDQAVA